MKTVKIPIPPGLIRLYHGQIPTGPDAETTGTLIYQATEDELKKTNAAESRRLANIEKNIGRGRSRLDNAYGYMSEEDSDLYDTVRDSKELEDIFVKNMLLAKVGKSMQSHADSDR